MTAMIRDECEKSMGRYMVHEYVTARGSTSRAITMLLYLDSEVLRVAGWGAGLQTVEFPRERAKFSGCLSNELWKWRTSPCPWTEAGLNTSGPFLRVCPIISPEFLAKLYTRILKKKTHPPTRKMSSSKSGYKHF